MTRNDDFERTLESWLRRQAPPQAPDRVLEAALQRTESESQRRGWLNRLVGGTPMTIMIRVAAVAAVLAIAAFIGFQFSNLPDNVGASPTPLPSPSAEPATSSAPSAPPESVEPSVEPSEAALVFELQGGTEAGRIHLVTVLEDGRIITTNGYGQQDGPNPPLERRLTAEGIGLLRDELEATGLTLLESVDYSPVPRPGAEEVGYGGAGPALTVGLPSGGTAVITWYLFADDPEQDYFLPQPEAEALNALAERLSTMEEWLPANAWADQTGVPYAPEQYRVWVVSRQLGGGELPVEHTTVSWPLVDGTDVFGDVVASVAQETGDGDSQSRCREMSADEAAPIVAALETAGARPAEGGIFPGQIFQLGNGATSRIVDVTFEPILPHADASCGVEETF
jgi:hypothetical protein